MKECPKRVSIISLAIMNQILHNPSAYRDQRRLDLFVSVTPEIELICNGYANLAYL